MSMKYEVLFYRYEAFFAFSVSTITSYKKKQARHELYLVFISL